MRVELDVSINLSHHSGGQQVITPAHASIEICPDMVIFSTKERVINVPMARVRAIVYQTVL